MTNSLERIFDGIIEILHTRVIPEIDDASVRGQAYGALDMLRNLKPRVEWAAGPLHEDVSRRLALIARIVAMLEGAGEKPPVIDAENVARSSGAELGRLRDRLDEHLCEVLRWCEKHRETLPAGRAAEIETAIRDEQRIDLKREVKLTAPPLFGEISRGR